jgi:hypothetical protein
MLTAIVSSAPHEVKVREFEYAKSRAMLGFWTISPASLKRRRTSSTNQTTLTSLTKTETKEPELPMSTIQTDVATNDFNDGADAADAFSSLWGLDAERPSEDTIDEPKKKTKQEEPAEDEDTNEGAEGDDKTSEETPEDDDDAEGDDEGDDGEGDEDDKEGDETPTVEIKDDHKFKVTVDGEEREFTLGSLKRLAGQEASLTRKSQEVATAASKWTLLPLPMWVR